MQLLCSSESDFSLIRVKWITAITKYKDFVLDWCKNILSINAKNILTGRPGMPAGPIGPGKPGSPCNKNITIGSLEVNIVNPELKN